MVEKEKKGPNWPLLACIGASAAVAPSAAVIAVHSLGFGTGGIATGTWASSFMASYGGHVGAGSLCSVLQSIGAVGLATKGALAASVVAASAATSVATVTPPVAAIIYKGASFVVVPVASSLGVVRDAGGSALSLAAKGTSIVVVPVAAGLATAWGIGGNLISLAHDCSSSAATGVVKFGSSAIGAIRGFCRL